MWLFFSSLKCFSREEDREEAQYKYLYGFEEYNLKLFKKSREEDREDFQYQYLYKFEEYKKSNIL